MLPLTGGASHLVEGPSPFGWNLFPLNRRPTLIGQMLPYNRDKFFKLRGGTVGDFVLK